MRIFLIIQQNKLIFIIIKNDYYSYIQSQNCGFNIINGRQKLFGWILLSIVNVTIYITVVYIVSFNTYVCSGSIIIFIVTIIKINCIVHLFIAIRITINYVINNAKRYEFVFTYIK